LKGTCLNNQHGLFLRAMTKTLLRYVLVLSVLLLNGHQQSAYAFSTLENSQQVDKVSVCIGSVDQHLIIKPASSERKKVTLKIDVTEVEEQEEDESESISFKKNLKGNGWLTVVDIASKSGFFLSHEKNLLTQYWYIFYTSQRYVIYQVFRI
jgi:hypothetical protein